MREGDELVAVRHCSTGDDILLVSRKGQAIRFSEADARAMGRATEGVRGMTLRGDDEVIAAEIARDDSDLLVVTENGYGKRTRVSEYPRKGRGGMGVQTVKLTEARGYLAGARVVRDGYQVMLISTGGTVIKMPVEDVKRLGRSTQGVIVMRLRDERDRLLARAGDRRRRRRPSAERPTARPMPRRRASTIEPSEDDARAERRAERRGRRLRGRRALRPSSARLRSRGFHSPAGLSPRSEVAAGCAMRRPSAATVELEPVDLAAHLDKVELYLGQVCRLAGISKMQLDYWTNKAQIPTKGKKQRIYDMRRDRDRDADQAGQGQGHEPRRGDRRRAAVPRAAPALGSRLPAAPVALPAFRWPSAGTPR